MKNMKLFAAGLLLSASVSAMATADSIKFWTMEIQPDRMAAQQMIADAFEAKTGHSVSIVPVEEAEVLVTVTV